MFAVICALEAELVHLRRCLDAPATVAKAGVRAVEVGELAGVPVVLARCGIGMTSAAAVTEAVLSHYVLDGVLNYGCAGAHRQDLLPGDIVVADAVVAYDAVMIEPDGSERYWAMHYLLDGNPNQVARLTCDASLFDAALAAANSATTTPPLWPVELCWPVGHAHRAPRIVAGTVCSANRWNRSRPHIEALVDRFGSACEDMEAAAIALVCASHRVAFLAIKDISNNELLATTTPDDFEAVLAEVGRRAGMIVADVVAQHR